jgi:hypothetical protein
MKKGKKVPSKMLFSYYRYNPAKAKFSEENTNKDQVDQKKVVVNRVIGVDKGREVGIQLPIDKISGVQRIEN